MSGAMIANASGATEFKLTGMAASLNFEESTFPPESVQTGILGISNHLRQTLQLQLPVQDHKATHAIVVVLGIEFYRLSKGAIEPMNKKGNALAVVKVFAPL